MHHYQTDRLPEKFEETKNEIIGDKHVNQSLVFGRNIDAEEYNTINELTAKKAQNYESDKETVMNDNSAEIEAPFQANNEVEEIETINGYRNSMHKDTRRDPLDIFCAELVKKP